MHPASASSGWEKGARGWHRHREPTTRGHRGRWRQHRALQQPGGSAPSEGFPNDPLTPAPAPPLCRPQARLGGGALQKSLRPRSRARRRGREGAHLILTPLAGGLCSFPAAAPQGMKTLGAVDVGIQSTPTCLLSSPRHIYLLLPARGGEGLSPGERCRVPGLICARGAPGSVSPFLANPKSPLRPAGRRAAHPAVVLPFPEV